MERNLFAPPPNGSQRPTATRDLPDAPLHDGEMGYVFDAHPIIVRESTATVYFPDGRRELLGGRRWRTLLKLVQAQGHVVTREALAELDTDLDITEEAYDARVRWLRRWLALGLSVTREDLIANRRGVGYLARCRAVPLQTTWLGAELAQPAVPTTEQQLLGAPMPTLLPWQPLVMAVTRLAARLPTRCPRLPLLLVLLPSVAAIILVLMPWKRLTPTAPMASAQPGQGAEQVLVTEWDGWFDDYRGDYCRNQAAALATMSGRRLVAEPNPVRNKGFLWHHFACSAVLD